MPSSIKERLYADAPWRQLEESVRQNASMLAGGKFWIPLLETFISLHQKFTSAAAAPEEQLLAESLERQLNAFFKAALSQSVCFQKPAIRLAIASCTSLELKEDSDQEQVSPILKALKDVQVFLES